MNQVYYCRTCVDREHTSYNCPQMSYLDTFIYERDCSFHNKLNLCTRKIPNGSSLMGLQGRLSFWDSCFSPLNKRKGKRLTSWNGESGKNPYSNQGISFPSEPHWNVQKGPKICRCWLSTPKNVEKQDLWNAASPVSVHPKWCNFTWRSGRTQAWGRDCLACCFKNCKGIWFLQDSGNQIVQEEVWYDQQNRQNYVKYVETDGQCFWYWFWTQSAL